MSVPAETRCGLQRPPTTEHTSSSKGAVHVKRVVASATQAPLTGPALAESVPSAAWSGRPVSAGTTGPIVSALARKRVTRCKEGLPERTVWLVSKRTLGASPPYSSSISHAPASPPLRLFVWCSGLRWALEQCCEETHTALGMAHSAVRQYPGWHHHLLTCLLAHCLLWRLTMRWGKKSPSADGLATAPLVRGDPPLPHLHGERSPRAGGVGPAVPSPGIDVAQQAS